MVVEPPRRAELHFAARACVVKAPRAGGELVVVGGVERVEYRLRQRVPFREAVEQRRERGDGDCVADCVAARVGAGLAQELRVYAADDAEVQLHRHAAAAVLPAEEVHHERAVGRGLVRRRTLAAERLAYSRLRGLFVPYREVGRGEGVVGEAAAGGGEVLDALLERGLHVVRRAYGRAGRFGELRGVGREVRRIDAERLVGAEGRQHLRLKAFVGREQLVPAQVVGGVVGRAERADVEGGNQRARGTGGALQLRVRAVPGGLRR